MSPTVEIPRFTPTYDSKDRQLIIFKNDNALQSTLEREETIEFHEIAS